jgi:anti-anti-sigma factor
MIKDESGHVLTIVGTLDIGVADELQKALCDFVAGDSMPAVDLAGVDACDTAAIQLLCSARKTAELSGKHFELAGVSSAIRNTNAALGLPLPEGASKRGDKGAV